MDDSTEVLTHVPGGATQDPFKILDRPFYAAPRASSREPKIGLFGAGLRRSMRWKF